LEQIFYEFFDSNKVLQSRCATNNKLNDSEQLRILYLNKILRKFGYLLTQIIPICQYGVGVVVKRRAVVPTQNGDLGALLPPRKKQNSAMKSAF